MFCKYCGSKLAADNAAFCHACGKATGEQPIIPAQPAAPAPVQQPVPVQVVYQQPAQPAYQVPVFQQSQYTYTVPPVQSAPAKPAVDPAELEALEKKALTHGILALSLCMLGVPGIVFGSIGVSKAGACKKLTGSLSGKARAGYKMAKAGKIVGIIMTVLLSIILPTVLEDGVLNNLDPAAPFEYFDY